MMAFAPVIIYSSFPSFNRPIALAKRRLVSSKFQTSSWGSPTEPMETKASDHSAVSRVEEAPGSWKKLSLQRKRHTSVTSHHQQKRPWKKQRSWSLSPCWSTLWKEKARRTSHEKPEQKAPLEYRPRPRDERQAKLCSWGWGEARHARRSETPGTFGRRFFKCSFLTMF